MGTVTLGRDPHNVTYNGCPVIGVPGSSLRTFASATAGPAAVRKRSGAGTEAQARQGGTPSGGEGGKQSASARVWRRRDVTACDA